jgi:hypothetical protein
MSCECVIRIPPPDRERQPRVDYVAPIRQSLAEVRAEAAYFTAVDGGVAATTLSIWKMHLPSPVIAEPFFLWLNAKVEFFPVMTPEDLAKAGPCIAAAVKKWDSEREPAEERSLFEASVYFWVKASQCALHESWVKARHSKNIASPKTRTYVLDRERGCCRHTTMRSFIACSCG